MTRPLPLLLLCLAACAHKPGPDAAIAPAEAPANSASVPDISAAAPAGTAAPAPTPPPAPPPGDSTPAQPTAEVAPVQAPASAAPDQATSVSATDASPAQVPPATPPPPAPPPPALPPEPAQATPPLPAAGPLPEVTDAGIGYPTREAALAALRQKPDAKVIEQDGWTTVQDQQDASHITLWSFTPPSHPAHPAMIKRAFYPHDGKAWMNMEVKCGATKQACDDLVRQFQSMDDELTHSARERVRKAAQPEQPASAQVALQPAPPPPGETPARTLPAPAQPAASSSIPREIQPAAPAAAPPDTLSATPLTARDLWSQALTRQCPTHHVEWLCTGCYTPLVAGFKSTLSAPTRLKLEKMVDSAPHCATETPDYACQTTRRFEAYRQLGLLHRLVLYSCAQVQCQAPANCSRSPR